MISLQEPPPDVFKKVSQEVSESFKKEALRTISIQTIPHSLGLFNRLISVKCVPMLEIQML